MDRKDKIIFILSGVIVGMIISALLAVFLVQGLKSGGADLKSWFKKTVKVMPHVSGNKQSFFVGFEQPQDADVFDVADAKAEISNKNAASGQHSLMVTFRAGKEYPGILWEVYGSKVQNWKGKSDFHFDVFNNDERAVSLIVKIKSGKDYPKSSFEFIAAADPLKSTHVSIPMEQISQTCDIETISYIKIFIKSPSMDQVLYFDNIGNVDVGSVEAAIPMVGRVEDKPKKSKKDLTKLKPGFEVVTASSLDRIFRDGQTLIPAAFSSQVNIALAKNESEHFQVVIKNGKDPLKGIQIEVSDLISSDGVVKISSKNFLVRTVGYVPTEKSYYPVKRGGEWPDPLLPTMPDEIASGDAQPFWITLRTDKNTQAGEYKGEVIVHVAGSADVRLSINVKVFDFVLPRFNHLRTAFDFYPHITKKWYPQKDQESDQAYQSRLDDLNDQFLVEIVKHRMDPVLNIDPTNNVDLGKVDRYRMFGLSNFAIGKKGGTFDNNWPKTDEDIEALLPLYRQYGELLALNKLFPYHYIYTWDEGEIGNPLVPKIASMIHRAHPKLKNMACYHGFWDPAKYPDWGKDIDIWCFGISDYNEKQFKKLVELGKEMWVYVSGPSSDGAPNLALDFDSIDYRILPWMCWKYNIKGFLYWCVNWWPNVDPFQSAKNTDWEQNGNGLLFYPGQDGPVMSIRTEIWQDGMEDYEYLVMLKKILDERMQKDAAFVSSSIYKEANELLNIEPAFISTFQSFNKDSQYLYSRRYIIAQKIEELTKGQ
ncbi:MAG: DUF4091 domain-containing protein [Candidatus Omnitrophica bacterium]|nr:DUF4091 domain-containing protein [Candidatus Omnitrophota bacterium]